MEIAVAKKKKNKKKTKCAQESTCARVSFSKEDVIVQLRETWDLKCLRDYLMEVFVSLDKSSDKLKNFKNLSITGSFLVKPTFSVLLNRKIYYSIKLICKVPPPADNLMMGSFSKLQIQFHLKPVKHCVKITEQQNGFMQFPYGIHHNKHCIKYRNFI